MKRFSPLGVVTVTYNAAHQMEEFLRCCGKQSHDNFELLIIDNASNDATVSVSSEHLPSAATIVENSENVGYAAACNQAIRYFKNKAVSGILFINNDTEFGPGLFEDLAKTQTAYAADALVPRIVLAADPHLNWYAGGRFVFWKAFQAEMIGENEPVDKSDTTLRYTPVAPGCCILFSMQTLDLVGPFDEMFFVYFEDTDYCLRMSYAGRKLLFAPHICLAHQVSSSTGGPVSKFSIRFYNRNQAYILRKHFALAIVLAQLPLIVAKAFLRFTLGKDTLVGLLLRLRSTWEGLRLQLPSETWNRYRVPKESRDVPEKTRVAQIGKL